jgi:hypothetical protein
VESQGANEAGATEKLGAPSIDAVSSGGAAAIAADDMGREREELRLVIWGFGTGMTIAAIFLAYIVIAYSGFLP